MVGLRDDFSYENDKELVASGLLPEPTNDFPQPFELFDDLIDEDYRKTLKTTEYPFDFTSDIQKNLRTRKDGSVAAKGDRVTDQEYSDHAERIVKKFQYMIQNNGKITEEMKTKKSFLQKN